MMNMMNMNNVISRKVGYQVAKSKQHAGQMRKEEKGMKKGKENWIREP